MIAGKQAEALRDLKEALDHAEGDDARHVSIDLGIVHHGAHAYDEAARCYEAALRGDASRVRARALGNLGALAHDRGSWDEAGQKYAEAIESARAFDEPRLEGTFRVNLGVLHAERGKRDAARAELERGLDLVRRAGDERLEAIALGNLGVLAHEEGDLEGALQKLTRARELLTEIGDVRSEGLARTRRGAVLAAMTRTEEAESELDRAERIFAALGDRVALGAVDLARGFVDLARWIGAKALGRADEEARLLASLDERMQIARTGDEAVAKKSDDARTFLRILDAALGRVAAGAIPEAALDDGALVVGPEARFYRPPGGGFEDLRTRKAARAILLALVSNHQQGDAGTGLTVGELYEAGWPGDRAKDDAAANRVHVNLAALRKRGLKALLVLRGDRYALDPKVRVQRVVSDWPGA